MKLRDLVRDSAVYGGINILTRAAGLFIVPVLTRYLSPAEFGAYDLIFLLLNVAQFIVGLEVMQGLLRRLGDLSGPEEMRLETSSALWFAAGSFSIVCAAAAAWAGPAAGLLFNGSDHAGMLQIAALWLWGMGISNILVGKCRFDGRPWAFAAIQISRSGLAAVTVPVLLIWFHAGLSGAILAQAAGALLASLLGVWFQRHSIGPVFDFGALRGMLAFSLPLTLSAGAVWVQSYADRFVLQSLLGLEAVGIYGLAYRVAMLVTLVSTGIDLAVMPMVYRSHAQPETPQRMADMFRYVMLLVSAGGLGLAALGPEMVTLFAGPEFRVGALPLIPPILAGIMLQGYYIFAPGLWITKRTTMVMAITISCGLLSLVLNILLVPHLGLLAPALGLIVCQGLATLLQMIFGQRHYPLPYDSMRLLSAVVLVGTGLALFRLINESATAFLPADTGWRLLIWLMFSLGTASILIRPSEAVALMRRPVR